MKGRNFIQNSLYGKILLIIFTTSLLTILTIGYLQENVLKKSYIDLEEDLSLKSLNRAQEALEREQQYIDNLLLDWSVWDDTYEFVSNPNDEYIDSNLYIDSFYNISLNFMYFFDSSGKLVWGDVYDFEEWESVLTNRFTENYIALDELIKISEPEMNRSGIMKTSLGLIFVASRPIFKSDGTGPPAGVMVVGRIINEAYLSQLQTIVQGYFTLRSEDLNGTLNEIYMSHDSRIMKKDSQSITLYTALNDINGSPSFILESVSDRSISRYGIRALELYDRMIIGLIVIITVIILLVIRVVIIGPLHRITKFLDSWEQEEGSPVTLETKRRDEIGTLSRGIETFARELETMATTDSLTGLNNRHIMDTLIPKLWQLLSRDQSEVSVILMDIDYFKKYNDTYGHQKGDECLKDVSSVIEKSVYRSTDMAIRYGGEEFLLILPATSSEGAQNIAQNIQNILAKAKIEHKSSDVSPFITLSIGVATTIPDRENNLDHLIELADNALYESKGKGRNRISIHGTK